MDELKQLINGKDYQQFKSTFVNDTPVLTSIFARWAKFESASPLIQDLLLQLYPDKFTMVTTPEETVHPLETYIFALDEVMGDAQMVRAVGSAIGINIPATFGYVQPYEIFIDKMVEHLDFLNSGLETRKDNVGLDIKSLSFPVPIPTTAEMMFYTRSKFKELLEKLKFFPTDLDLAELMYQDRLTVLRDIYRGRVEWPCQLEEVEGNSIECKGGVCRKVGSVWDKGGRGGRSGSGGGSGRGGGSCGSGRGGGCGGGGCGIRR